MATTIEPVPVAPERYSLWGVEVKNYKVNGANLDFETIIVEVAAGRATTIEKEVVPLNTQVQRRNEKLTLYGNALAYLSGQQTKIEDSKRYDAKIYVDPNSDTAKVLKELNINVPTDGNISYAQCEQAVQQIKTTMDKLNNDAQSDMTRLQSLVSKRDESFTTASTMMTAVSDTRSSAIKAIGG